MKVRVIVLASIAGFLLCVPFSSAFAQAPAAPQAQPAPAAGQPDPTGHVGGPGIAAPAVLPPAPPAHACLQLHHVSGVIENFNVTFNPNVAGFPITGGTMTGGICNSSQWQVTGGHLQPNLAITATRPAGGNCSTQLTVAGNFVSPSSWTGTYGFPGTGFQQHTLFLGYQKSSCP